MTKLSKLEGRWAAEDAADHETVERSRDRREKAGNTQTRLRELLLVEPADSPTFALHLAVLAKAWGVYPGNDAYWRYPLRATSRAEELGKQLWESALRGWKKGRLEALHAQALHIAEKHGGSPEDLLRFFRQLDAYYWEGPLSAGAPAWHPPELVAEIEGAVKRVVEGDHVGAKPAPTTAAGENAPQALNANEITTTQIRSEHGVSPSTLHGWCNRPRNPLRQIRQLPSLERVFDRRDLQRFLDAWRSRRSGRHSQRGSRAPASTKTIRSDSQ